MDWHRRTIETYDQSALELAEYFRGIGPRVADIVQGLDLAGKDYDAVRVVEIGCGDGRDAAEIVPRSAWYEGFDPSRGLLAIAQYNLPQTSFVQADALSYDYPENVDVYFAFASLLHVSRADMPLVLRRIHGSLNDGGILYVSLKERAVYTEEVKADDYGTRMFYYYNPGLLKELAGDGFTTVHEDHQYIGNTEWFTLALRKVT